MKWLQFSAKILLTRLTLSLYWEQSIHSIKYYMRSCYVVRNFINNKQTFFINFLKCLLTSIQHCMTWYRHFYCNNKKIYIPQKNCMDLQIIVRVITHSISFCYIFFVVTSLQYDMQTWVWLDFLIKNLSPHASKIYIWFAFFSVRFLQWILYGDSSRIYTYSVVTLYPNHFYTQHEIVINRLTNITFYY